MFDTLLRDLKYSLRSFARSPAFASVALFMLGLGIGANTAIFSVVNGILLQALPYPQPAQLYAVHEFVPQLSTYGSLPVNGGNFLAWKRESHVFSAMTLIAFRSGSLLGIGRPQWLYGAAVTSDFFSILGVQPLMGRTLLSEDGASGGKPEVILTHRLWREGFHSDPNILGKIVRLGDLSLTIIGVLPANFIFPRVFAHDPQYLVPFSWTQSNSKPGIGTHNYFVIARLKNGVTPKQAEAQLNVIEGRIAKQDTGGKFNLYAILTPLKTEIVGSTRKVLWVLAIAAGLVLLIVCANLANLLLTKNSKRVREVALRSVLGASRWRLVRQFLTEIFVLASAGGSLGLLFAAGGLWLLIRNAPVAIPRVDQIRLDSTVLWFTLAVTILAALVFGLLPSLRATQAQLSEQLKSAGPTLTASKEGGRLRATLVIGEIALCAALLPASLLLVKSLHHVVLANQWMDEERVIAADLFVQIPLSQTATNNDSLRAFHERDRIFASIEEKVSGLPEVESAGFTSRLPLEGEGWGDALRFQEIPLPEAEQPAGEFRFVSPGYFHTIGLSLVRGRFFTPADDGQPVAVISESIVRKVLGGRDPLGMHVDCRDVIFDTQRWCRVVGEVSDVRARSDQAPLLVAYFPLWIYSDLSETLVVRTKMEPAAAGREIREAIWSVEPGLAIRQEKNLKAILASAEAPRRYETSLVTLFAVCAVLLAMLGLYAVISYSVTNRKHEIAIRMAMGAQRRDILRLVLRKAMLFAVAGIAAGIGGALLLTQLLRGILFEIQPTDPPTYIAVAVLLAAVALAACWIPTQRAMRIHPIEGLRYE